MFGHGGDSTKTEEPSERTTEDVVESMEILHPKIGFEDKHRFKCLFCSFACVSKIDLELHEKCHLPAKPRKCSECDFKCKTKADFTNHRRKHAFAGPYKCPECGNLFKTPSGLAGHRKSHLDGPPIKCAYCNYTNKRKAHLSLHERWHHDISKTPSLANDVAMPFQCKMCFLNFNSEIALTQHQQKAHHSVTELSMSTYGLCSKSVITSYENRLSKNVSLDESVKKEVKAVNHEISVKFETFERRLFNPVNEEGTSRSINVNAINVPVNADVIDSSLKVETVFPSKVLETGGRTSDHLSHSFPCHVCSQTFRLSYNLQVHLKSHVFGDFKCRHCKFTCKSKLVLDRHEQKNHSEERSLKCTRCFYDAKTKQGLEVHLKTHDVQNHKCYSCDYTTKYRKHLILHEKRHTQISSAALPKHYFECKVCHVTFSSQIEFAQHRCVVNRSFIVRSPSLSKSTSLELGKLAATSSLNVNSSDFRASSEVAKALEEQHATTVKVENPQQDVLENINSTKCEHLSILNVGRYSVAIKQEPKEWEEELIIP